MSGGRGRGGMKRMRRGERGRMQHLEGGLELGLVFELLLQVHAEDHVARGVEGHLRPVLKVFEAGQEDRRTS